MIKDRYPEYTQKITEESLLTLAENEPQQILSGKYGAERELQCSIARKGQRSGIERQIIPWYSSP